MSPEAFAVFAGVLPEDKFNLVKAFQKVGYAVGMCGAGADDTPALRQAQIGIAVSTATDVAKSAAGMMLTEVVAGALAGAIAFAFLMDFAKVPIFSTPRHRLTPQRRFPAAELSSFRLCTAHPRAAMIGLSRVRPWAARLREYWRRERSASG